MTQSNSNSVYKIMCSSTVFTIGVLYVAGSFYLRRNNTKFNKINFESSCKSIGYSNITPKMIDGEYFSMDGNAKHIIDIRIEYRCRK
uniref:Uncharacterized protein n=1 Tax=viral metagenome TaxID=1070528 RepID=A0A6C0EA16_9ZZZZ